MEWTTEAVNAEIDYRRYGTLDRTAVAHLRDVPRARHAPSWLRRSRARQAAADLRRCA